MTKAKTQVIDIDNHLDFKAYKGINVADPIDNLDIVNLRTLRQLKDEMKYKIGDGIDLELDVETGKINILITEVDPHIYPAILAADGKTFVVETQNFSPRSFKLSLTQVLIHIDSDMPDDALLKLLPYSATFYIFENGERVKSGGIKAGATLHLVSIPKSYHNLLNYKHVMPLDDDIAVTDMMSIISCTHKDTSNFITAGEVDGKIAEVLGNIEDMLDAINRE